MLNHLHLHNLFPLIALFLYCFISASFLINKYLGSFFSPSTYTHTHSFCDLPNLCSSPTQYVYPVGYFWTLFIQTYKHALLWPQVLLEFPAWLEMAYSGKLNQPTNTVWSNLRIKILLTSQLKSLTCKDLFSLYTFYPHTLGKATSSFTNTDHWAGVCRGSVLWTVKIYWWMQIISRLVCRNRKI